MCTEVFIIFLWFVVYQLYGKWRDNFDSVGLNIFSVLLHIKLSTISQCIAQRVCNLWYHFYSFLELLFNFCVCFYFSVFEWCCSIWRVLLVNFLIYIFSKFHSFLLGSMAVLFLESPLLPLIICQHQAMCFFHISSVVCWIPMYLLLFPVIQLYY